MPKYQKITLLIIFGALILGYNNCGKVQFSDAPNSASALGGPTGSNPGGPTGPSATPPPSSVQLSPVVNAVAFEDLYYPRTMTCTDCPDYDYNDFLTNFKVQEVSNSQNQLTDIYIDFYPRAVGAGYDHTFYLVLNGVVSTTSVANYNILPVTKPMFKGAATVTLSYYDQNGNPIANPAGTSANPAYNQDIVVFPTTHGIFGAQPGAGVIDTSLPSGYTSGVPSNYIAAQQNARVHISLSSPALNPAPASGLVDPSTLRMILRPTQTNYDIDIINVDPTNFVGSTGYPWGFIIPTDWQWMTEGVKITNGYPELIQYGDFLLGQPATGDYMNWFNYPVQPAPATILYPSVPWSAFLPAIP